MMRFSEHVKFWTIVIILSSNDDQIVYMKLTKKARK